MARLGSVVAVGGPKRLGGNVTAITSEVGATIPKRLELLKTIAPRVAKVAILTIEGRDVVDIEASARTLGLTLAWINVEEPAGIDAGLARALDERADAILVDSTGPTFARRRTIAGFALQHRLPTISSDHEFVEAGGLLAYDVSASEITRLAASYVDKILKGTKPSDLPVVRPAVFDLVVNARTARALGLAIPPALQLRITRIVE